MSGATNSLTAQRISPLTLGTRRTAPSPISIWPSAKATAWCISRPIIRILAPENLARGNHRLLFDVPNRGNRLALATFNGVPRPINPAAPTDAGNGFLMRHGYTVV
jgi:hypothetical protein